MISFQVGFLTPERRLKPTITINFAEEHLLDSRLCMRRSQMDGDYASQ